MVTYRVIDEASGAVELVAEECPELEQLSAGDVVQVWPEPEDWRPWCE